MKKFLLLFFLFSGLVFGVTWYWDDVKDSGGNNLSCTGTDADTSTSYSMPAINVLSIDYKASATDSANFRLVLQESNQSTPTYWINSDSTANCTDTLYRAKKFTTNYNLKHRRIIMRGLSGNKIGTATSVSINLLAQG